MREVARGIYAIGGLKTGRSYLIEERDGLALIDTSSPSASKRIIAAIESIGRRVDELTTIVATHYHFDHVGNAAALVERSGAQLCVHEDDVPYVEGRTPWLPTGGVAGPMVDKSGPKQFSVKVGRTLIEGEALPLAGGLEVLHTPGHTPGHIALYSKERGVLFAGDALMNIVGLRLPLSMSSHDMAQARESVRRMAELDFDIALPGHGAPIVSRASEKIGEWARRWL